MNGRDFKIFLWPLWSTNMDISKRVSKLVSFMGQTTVAKPEFRSTKKKQAKCESKKESNLIMLLRDLSSKYGHNYACQSLNR